MVASPKLLLRHPTAKSTVSELAPGTSFQPVLDDPSVRDPSVSASLLSMVHVQAIKKIVLCSGKFFYELEKARPSGANTAIIRLEELSPFPAAELKAVLARYPSAKGPST